MCLCLKILARPLSRLRDGKRTAGVGENEKDSVDVVVREIIHFKKFQLKKEALHKAGDGRYLPQLPASDEIMERLCIRGCRDNYDHEPNVRVLSFPKNGARRADRNIGEQTLEGNADRIKYLFVYFVFFPLWHVL